MSNIDDSSMENFGFAFNDRDFSDRVLHIEVIPDELSLSSKLGKTLFLNSPRQTHSNDSDSSVGVQLKTVYLSSLMLAAKSPFFFKLFKNGMSESHQREATLRIYSSEEAAVMDLLKFMYTNTLSAATTSDLLDVFIAADKFAAKSCVKYCLQLLLGKSMSLKSTLLFLELPKIILAAEPLIDASKQFLFAHYSDLENSKEEAMKLPLSAVEIVLGSEGLRVNSEDDVFEFILKWGRAHYPKFKERRRILTEHMLKLIRFPYMSCSKLKEVLVCADFYHEHASKLVMEAFILKDDALYGQYGKTSLSKRLYNFRLVKVVPLEFPSPRCLVYFDLKKDELENLSALQDIGSEKFLVGGRPFFLSLQWDDNQVTSLKNFVICLYMLEGSESCTLTFQYAVMKKPSNNYEIQNKGGNIAFTTEKLGYGCYQPFGVSWTAFMKDDSEYFIDGILHLQLDITIINSQD